MIHFRQATIRIDGRLYTLAEGRTTSFEHFYVDVQNDTTSVEAQWHFFLHPKTDLRVDEVEVQFHVPVSAAARFFANGFQSWSESRLLDLTAGIPRLRRVARAAMGWYGDERIAGIPRGKGVLHSWTYTYFSRPQENLLFFGSLSERSGFTLFIYDACEQVLSIRKDLRAGGLAVSHSFPLLSFWVAQLPEKTAVERYAALLEIPAPRPVEGLGWTSWYRHFTAISAAKLRRDLVAVQESGLPFRYFQIDDGWQTAVGDWLSVKADFPQGLAAFAAEIKAQNLRPGIWVAPFVAAKNAEIIRKNPDWCLRDAKGRAIRVGWNPMWGGWYYALDFYQQGVRDYLSGVFHVLGAQCGFELFKLDFLFAVCIAPPPGKTRGQVMHEALEFLREQLGDRLMLGCGVPLGSAPGLADAMRIGGDVHIRWEHRLLRWLRHRERVDTLASLHATLGRWQLNGPFWCNDPDVFILRSTEQYLHPAQQHTLLVLNALLGKVFFTSDDVAAYSTEQGLELEAALELRHWQVHAVTEVCPELYRIDCTEGGQAQVVWSNLSARRVQVPGTELELRAFETWV